MREYYQLIQTTGCHLKDRSMAITQEDFGAGYTQFFFNLDPDEGFSRKVLLIKTGNLRLEVRLRTLLSCTVNLIYCPVFDSVIEIKQKTGASALLLMQHEYNRIN